MNSLLRLPAQVSLGILTIAGLVVSGLRFRWLDAEDAKWFQGNLGYYVVLTLVILWGILFGQAARTAGWFSKVYWRSHLAGLGLVAASTLFLHLHEPHVMRVLHDEPTHALTSLVMHLDKQALVAPRSNYYGESFVLTQHVASFRQYLFPFLLSLLHDVSGYRIANVFVLNFLLTPAVLLAAYFLAVSVAGRLAGGIAVILLGTLPLLAQNVTSGGYDVLNMALVGALILSTIAYTQADTSQRGLRLNVSLAFALLLTVARSESILYLIPWAIVVATVWWRERRVELTPLGLFSPLFLMPNLMCNMVLSSRLGGNSAHMRKAGEAFFDPANLPNHLSDAAYYWFHYHSSSTASVLLSSLGVIGFVALLIRTLTNRRTNDAGMVFFGFTVSTTLIYLFVLTHFWGSPTDTLAARFCLPLMLVWAVCGAWFVVQFKFLQERPRLIFGALALWCVVATVPAVARSSATYDMRNSRGEEWFLRYAATRDRFTTMFVAQSNVGLVARRFAASELPYVCQSPATFVRALKAGLYREIIVFQVRFVQAKTGKLILHPGHASADNLVLETIEERQFTPFYRVIVSRMVGYRKPDGTIVTADSDDPEVNVRESFDSVAEGQAYKLSLYP